MIKPFANGGHLLTDFGHHEWLVNYSRYIGCARICDYCTSPLYYVFYLLRGVVENKTVWVIQTAIVRSPVASILL